MEGPQPPGPLKGDYVPAVKWCRPYRSSSFCRIFTHVVRKAGNGIYAISAFELSTVKEVLNSLKMGGPKLEGLYYFNEFNLIWCTIYAPTTAFEVAANL